MCRHPCSWYIFPISALLGANSEIQRMEQLTGRLTISQQSQVIHFHHVAFSFKLRPYFLK